MEIIVRSDDNDWRLELDEVVALHQQFVDREIVETAVLQFARNGNICNMRQEVVDYMNNSPYWDFQIHGWEHKEYDKFDLDYIIKDLAACSFFIQKLFHKTPTVWYPPWNKRNSIMEKAAKFMDLTLDNESYDIAKFIREAEAGMYQGHTFYFHGWNKKETVLLPRALDLVKILAT